MRRDTDRGNIEGSSRSPARVQHLSIAAHGRFDEYVCPTCGQQLHQSQEGHSDHSGIIGETEAVQAGGRVGPAKWFTVALLSIFAAALFIGWRGERSEPVSEPDGLRPFTENTSPESPLADTNDASTGGELDGELTNGVLSKGAIVTTQRTLASLMGRHRLAYVAADGVVIVNPTAVDPVSVVTAEQVTMNDLLTGFDSFSMFEEQGHTYGFKRDAEAATQRVYLLFTQGEVIAGEKSSFALAVGGTEVADHLYVGNSSGLFMSRIDVPVGAKLLAVPSVGVLAVSSTGETFVTTQSGFTHYSDWPVIAANETYRVEIRCGEPLACNPVLVDHLSGAVRDLPVEFAGSSVKVTIAPDGARLLLVEQGTDPSDPDRVYDVAATELAPLTARVGNTPVWAPDSTIAAWMDPATTDPRLWVFDVATAEILSVDLTSLGAPKRSGNALLLLPQ